MPGAILCLSVFGSERHPGQGQLAAGCPPTALDLEATGAAASNSAAGANLDQAAAAAASSSSSSGVGPASSLAAGAASTAASQGAGANLRAQDSAGAAAHHYSSFDSRKSAPSLTLPLPLAATARAIGPP